MRSNQVVERMTHWPSKWPLHVQQPPDGKYKLAGGSHRYSISDNLPISGCRYAVETNIALELF